MGKVEMLTLPHFDQAAVREALTQMLSGELTTSDLHDIVKEQLEKAEIVASEHAMESLSNSFTDLDLEFSDIVRSEVDEQTVTFVSEEPPVEERPEQTPAEEDSEDVAEEKAFVISSAWDSDEFLFEDQPEFSTSHTATEEPASAGYEPTPEEVSATEEVVVETTPELGAQEQPGLSDFAWGDDDGSLTFSDQVELTVEDSVISADFKPAEDT